jgi:hypothetical protein
MHKQKNGFTRAWKRTQQGRTFRTFQSWSALIAFLKGKSSERPECATMLTWSIGYAWPAENLNTDSTRCDTSWRLGLRQCDQSQSRSKHVIFCFWFFIFTPALSRISASWVTSLHW